MATWLYQLNANNWSAERYRLEIWEGERWNWSVGTISGKGQHPEEGDIVVFFYAPSKSTDPGFYGWAVVLGWVDQVPELHFRPVAPSDHLKMHPWWDGKDGWASQLADAIRGKMKQGTLCA